MTRLHHAVEYTAEETGMASDGAYTLKTYFIKDHVPKILAMVVKDEKMVLREHSWASFPTVPIVLCIGTRFFFSFFFFFFFFSYSPSSPPPHPPARS